MVASIQKKKKYGLKGRVPRHQMWAFCIQIEWNGGKIKL